MISKSEILMGRDTKYPSDYTKEVSDNIDKILEPLNIVRKRYAKPMYVSSGWRPLAINSRLSNAGKKSNHIKGLAVDFKDTDGSLRKWVIDHIEWLAGLGFYFEDFRWTKNWVHFQLIAPKSGRRIYIPNSKQMPYPEAWDGKYNTELNYK